MKKNFCFILITITSFGLTSSKLNNKIKYLPLGDSYTICTGTQTEKDTWPYLLTQHLSKNNFSVELLPNPARNGYSTQQLIDEELPLANKYKPSIVTVLIGVNDWVRNVNAADFEKNLNYIIEQLQLKLPNKRGIILITIPDFGVTSQGKYYGGGRNISQGIMAFNSIIKKAATKFQLECVDIFDLSKAMGKDSSLVAPDGLHPSAKEYALWEPLIYEKVKKVLEELKQK
jgi:acyl-CoA thioesterase I